EEQRPDLGLGAAAIGRRERLEIQPVEQLAMDARLHVEITGARRRRGGPRRYGWRLRKNRWGTHRLSLEHSQEHALAFRLGFGLFDQAQELAREGIELAGDFRVVGQRQ